MTLIDFPDPLSAPDGDVVAIGGQLNVENLLRAYRRGIFPWPVEGYPLLWFCPTERAILEVKDLHIPRTLRQAQRRAPYRFTIDQAFDTVLAACAETPRADGEGTWITDEITDAYRALHRAGHAHSVEAWEADGQLAGGLYGVDAGGAFAGESMFYRCPNASKLALLHLLEHLGARGLDWIDIQVITPHLQALGARLVERDEFLARLARTRARGLKLF